MWLKIIFTFVCLAVPLIKSNHVSIVGPLISKGGNTFKAYVAVSETKNPSELAVVLNCSNERSHKTFDLMAQGQSLGELSFNLTSSPIGRCHLISVVRQNNNCWSDQADFHNEPNLFVLIQFDKPIYRPNDVVSYQIIVLDGETKPVQYDSLQVEFLDGNDKKVYSSMHSTKEQRKKYGFYQGNFSIANEPNLGTWAMQVNIESLNVESKKYFKVENYVLPSFKVAIDTKAIIPFADKNLRFNITVKYPFDKFVSGNADVTVSVRNPSNPSRVLSSYQKSEVMTGPKEIVVNLAKDLKMNFLSRNVIVALDVKFREDITKITAEGYKEVTVTPKSDFIVHAIKKERFRPGFDYTIDALITDLEGNAVNSSLPLTLKLKYHYKNGQTSTVSHPNFPKEGRAKYTFAPPIDAEKIEMSFEYNDNKNLAKEEIQRVEQSTSGEHLQAVILNENIKVNDIINISVEGNAIFEDLHLVVIGTTGIVYTNIFEVNTEDHSTKTEISFKVTPEMAPSADIIVFYLRTQDGVMIYDQLEIKLGMKNDNFLTIKTPKESKKIRESVTIQTSSKPNSLIALLAVDQAVTFMGTDNIISKSFVDEKKSHDSKKFIDYNGRNAFGLANAFRISPTSTRKHSCSDSENVLFENNFIIRKQFEPLTGNAEIDDVRENIVRRNFPEVWFQDVHELLDDTYNRTFELPDSVTTWIVSGYSINPEFGLAVAEQQKVKIFQNFFIRVEKPYSVKPSEEPFINIIVHNYKNESANVKITLIGNERRVNFLNGASRNVTVEPQSTAMETFQIKPIHQEEIFLTAKATSNVGFDAVEVKLMVEQTGINIYETSSIILDLKNTPQLEEEVEFKPVNPIEGSLTFEAIATTDFMGPALNNVEKLISLAEGCGEQKMRIFATTLIALRYTIETKQANEKELEDYHNILDKTLQVVMAMQNNDGSFNLWGDYTTDKINSVLYLGRHDSYLDLSAYVVKLMAQFEEIKPLPDRSAVDKTMEYIKGQQLPDGSFLNNGKPKFRDLKRFSNIKGVSLTAYILIGILESEYLRDNYMSIVDKGLKFFKEKFENIISEGTNYEKAMTLYLYVLAERNEIESRNLLRKLNSVAKTDDDKKYWESNPKLDTEALQIETSSYVALALIKMKKYDDVMPIIRFLMSMRNPLGGSKSTVDTLLSLQALSEISKHLYSNETAMSVNVSNESGDTKTLKVGARQARSVDTGLSSSSGRLKVTATGKGVASLLLTCQYRKTIESSQLFNNYFGLRVNPQKDEGFLELEVCVRNQKDSMSNMALMEIALPSGYMHHYGPEIKSNVKRVELKSEKTKILIYLESVTPQETCVGGIQAVATSHVENLAEAVVTIYDYYAPDNNGYANYKI